VGLGEKSTRLSALRGASRTAQKQPKKYPEKLVFSNRKKKFLLLSLSLIYLLELVLPGWITTAALSSQREEEEEEEGGGGG
jgi:hypothetical protein